MPLPTFFNLPETKRQAILDCAIDEFAQHDYPSASISKIVSRAGIAKGSLYQYFVDKKDLHSYLLERSAQKKAELMRAFKPPTPDLNLFDSLRYLYQVMVTFDLQYPKLAKIGSRALSGNAPLPEDVMTKAKQASQSYFQSLLEQAKQRGEIRPDVDPSMAAFLLTSAMSGLSDYLKSRNQPIKAQDIESSFDQVISILKNGIANPFNESGKQHDQQP